MMGTFSRRFVASSSLCPPGAVLVQHEHLAGGEPAQRGEGVLQAPLQAEGLQPLEEQRVVAHDGVGADELLHAVLPVPRLARPRLPARARRRAVARAHRGRGFVRLARGAVKCHHPVLRILNTSNIFDQQDKIDN